MIPVFKCPEKQPFEEAPITRNAKGWMAKGETLTEVLARCYEKEEGDPDTAYVAGMVIRTNHDGATTFSVTVAGGETGLTYRVRVRMTTAAGNKYECELEFKVREVV